MVETIERYNPQNDSMTVSREFVEAVRKTINPAATDAEIAVFGKVAEQNGLSAFSEMCLIKGPSGKCQPYVNKYGLFRKLNERGILPLQPYMKPGKNPLTGADDIQVIAPFEFEGGKIREWHIWVSEYSHKKGQGAYAQFPVQMLYTRAQTYAARQICNVGIPSVEEMEAVWEREKSQSNPSVSAEPIAQAAPLPPAPPSPAPSMMPKLTNATLTAPAPGPPAVPEPVAKPLDLKSNKGRPHITWEWLKERITSVRDVETADRFYQTNLSHATRFAKETEFRHLYEDRKDQLIKASGPPKPPKVDDPGAAIITPDRAQIIKEIEAILKKRDLEDLCLCDLFMEEDGRMPYLNDAKIPTEALAQKLEQLKNE